VTHSQPGEIGTPPRAHIDCLIADDHVVVRTGLRLVFSRTPHINVVGEAGSGEAAVALAALRRPHVVVMDLRMGDMDGIEAAAAMQDTVPDARVCLFTAQGERSLLARGRAAGCRGFVHKQASPATIVRAVEAAARDREFIDPLLAPSLITSEYDDLLSDRETEILQLMATGAGNAEIATELHIGAETVKSHVSRILVKLQADNRAGAVAKAFRQSLIR
jgi:DNA-binding NarL/FixJ family response regulator